MIQRRKKALKTLSWLNPLHEPPKLLKVTTSTQTFLVPKVFEQDVPATSRKPNSWFKGHHLRHSFFQTKGLFLVSLQDMPAISKVSIMQNQLSPVIDAWMSLQQKQDAILQELDEGSKPTKPTLGILQGKTRNFLKKWNAYLVEQRTNMLNSKLQLIERMANHLQSFQDVGKTRDVWSLCSLLKKFIKKLKTDLLAYPDEKLTQRLHQVEQQIKPFVAHHRLIRLIDDIAAGKAMRPEDILEAGKLIQEMKEKDSNTHLAFLELCQPQLKQISKMLHAEWKAQPLEHRYPERHAKRLFHLHHIMTQCGDVILDLENQSGIAKRRPRYFLNYLMCLQACGSKGEKAEEAQVALEAMEEVLLTFETEDTFANKTITQHVKELKALREKALSQKDFWILIYARSNAVADIVQAGYLKKRLQKDVAKFDEQLFSLIRQDKKLPFNEVTIQEIQKLSDHYNQEKKASLDELTLAPEQKTILGLNGGHCAYIQDLLEIRKTIYSEQEAILSPSLSLDKRVHRTQALAKEVKQGLQKISTFTQHSFFSTKSSKHEELFTKTYLHPALVSTI